MRLGGLGQDVVGQGVLPRQDSVLNPPPGWNPEGDDNRNQGDRIFIAFLIMCANALNTRFQFRVSALADRVNGCTARNVSVKGHLRMNGKLFQDHADMEFPRAAHNADIVRAALICSDPESLCEAFELSRHPVHGIGRMIRVKNLFTPPHDAMNSGSFGYRAVLVNYIFSPGLTWGEILEEDEEQVNECIKRMKAFHTKSSARYNDEAMRGFEAAEAAFRSPAFLSTPAQLLVEIQFITEDYFRMRKKSHFWYKIARAASGFHLCLDFRAVLAQ